jgi:hypothetical protein
MMVGGLVQHGAVLSYMQYWYLKLELALMLLTSATFFCQELSLSILGSHEDQFHYHYLLVYILEVNIKIK